jgi:hypothetical protein
MAVGKRLVKFEELTCWQTKSNMISVLVVVLLSGCGSKFPKCDVSKLDDFEVLTPIISKRYEMAYAGTKVLNISYSRCIDDDREAIGSFDIDKCVMGNIKAKSISQFAQDAWGLERETRRYLDLCGNVIASFDD